VEVEISVSPYDVPEAVRGDYDEEKKRFVIEFSYPTTDDNIAVQDFDRFTRIGIGRASGRLYRVELDVDAMKAEAVGLRLQVARLVDEVRTAINNFGGQRSRWREGNYRMATEVIASRGPELFEPLTAAVSNN
jgi:hypothetical protein